MFDGFVQFLNDFRDSEKDLKYFLEQLPVPLMLCREWEIVYFNSALQKTFPGGNPFFLIGRNVLDFVQSKERRFIEKHRDRFRSGELYRFNLKVQAGDVMIDLSTFSRSLQLGGTSYMLIAFQDISRLSQREKNLFKFVVEVFPLNGSELYQEMMAALTKHLEVDFAAFIEYGKDAKGEDQALMLAGNLDGKNLQINYYELKNTMAEKLRQQGILIIERDLYLQEPENYYIQQNRFQAFIGVHLRAGKKDLGLYVLSRRPIYDTAGIAFVLNICGVRLVSEYTSQEARTRIEQHERDSRLIIEQSADPMFILDSQGRILLANNRAADLTRYAKSELRDFFELIAAEHRPFFRSFFQKSYGVLNHSNVILVRKDMTRVYCDLTGVILSDGRIQLILRDNTETLLNEIALKQSEEKYRSVFDNASDAIYIADWKTGRILDCNPSFVRLIGLSREAILEQTHFDLIPEQDRLRFSKIFEHLKRRGRLETSPIRFRLTISNERGHRIPIEIGFTVTDKNGHKFITSIIRDLTASYQAIEEHKKYLQTLSMLQVIVVELDKDLRIQFISNPIPKFGASVGRNLHGLYFPEVASEDYRWYVQVTLEDLLETRTTKTIRFPNLSKQTGMDWYEGQFVIVRDRNSGLRIRGLIKDVTFEYIVEKQTYFVSNTDMLTSLPNRNRLDEDLFRAMLRAERTGKKLAVGFIDLDRFYDVNELLGHRLGDLALAVFAEKLRGIHEMERSLFRWGGDQFVFILEDIDDLSPVRRILNDIRDRAREPLTIEGQSVHLTCTAGVAIFPDDAQTIDGLFGQADRALQAGKRNGRFQFLLAQDVIRHEGAGDRMSVRNRLSHAINHGLVEPYLQPIYDTEKQCITGMEALARIPEIEGLPAIGPDVFIPIAEDLGIIEELSQEIIEGAVEFRQYLASIGFDLRLSVNLSRRVLYSDRLIDYLQSLLEKTGTDPGRICLEITETLAMLDMKNASERLHELKKLGFKIAIDDFGTGYSTLGQLHEIPADELKIDKLFVRRIHTLEGMRIAEAIVNMARALKLEIVAEGVEDLETVAVLQNMGVHYLQGYLYSSPLNREQFEAYLRGGFNAAV
jgi:diguanylate cyclase (GGDEF)-like protein/PAS domain S-box-containing protein